MNNTSEQVNRDPQAMLQALVGQWQGMTRTWFEPGKLSDESPWQATISPLLGDRYIRYEYTGSLQGETFEGKATLGYNAMTQQFEMAWIDSFHQNNGIMHCKGNTGSQQISVLSSYIAFEGGEVWGWRTEFDLVDANHLTVRAYNIEPSGNESLGLETTYTRQ
jgi:hypothetical protein